MIDLTPYLLLEFKLLIYHFLLFQKKNITKINNTTERRRERERERERERDIRDEREKLIENDPYNNQVIFEPSRQ